MCGDFLGCFGFGDVVLVVLCFLGEVFVYYVVVDFFGEVLEEGFFVGVGGVFDELYDIDFYVMV